MLLEKNLVRDRGWVEFSVYPLFSPQSLIAEGHGELRHRRGVPESGAARVRAPCDLSGRADSIRSGAADYYESSRWSIACRTPATKRRAGTSTARSTRKAAADWLERYALYSPPRAEQRVRFIDQYRSYVINYNLGKDMVKRYIEAQGGTPANAGEALAGVRAAASRRRGFRQDCRRSFAAS